MLLTTQFEKNIFEYIAFQSSNFVRVLFGKGVVLLEGASEGLQNTSELKRENALLKSEIEAYKQQLQSVSALQFENKMLRDILQFSLSIKYTVFPAQIISKGGITDSFSRILIDAGKRTGITKDMAVIAPYKNSLVVIGKITDVSLNAAQFVPITDDHFFFPAKTIHSAQNGILSGKSNKENLMLFSNESIYDANKIFVGEQVVVNKYSKFFPRGIPIGEIAEVTSSEEDSLLRAYVRPYVRTDELDYVFVVIPKAYQENLDNTDEEDIIIDDDLNDNTDNEQSDNTINLNSFLLEHEVYKIAC